MSQIRNISSSGYQVGATKKPTAKAGHKPKGGDRNRHHGQGRLEGPTG